MNEKHKKAIENSIVQWESMLGQVDEQKFIESLASPENACTLNLKFAYILNLKRDYCRKNKKFLCNDCFLCEVSLEVSLKDKILNCDLCPAKAIIGSYSKYKCRIKEYWDCLYSETFEELKINMQKFIDRLKTLLTN